MPEAWHDVWDDFAPPISEVVARLRKTRGISGLGLTFANDLLQLLDAAEKMLAVLPQRKV